MYAAVFALSIALLPQDLSREDMGADLEAFARGVSATWAYLDDKREHFGLDLEALVAAEAARLPQDATREEFALVLQRLVAALGDGHAGLSYEAPLPTPRRRWPLKLRETAEGLALERCTAEGGPAPGDLWRAADGRPADELWRAAQALTTASTPGMRRAQALERLARCDAAALAFEFESPDGTRSSFDLATLAIDDARLDARSEAPWSLDEIAPGVARLRIASFGVPDWRAWKAADQGGRDALQVEVKAAIDALFVGLAAQKPKALLLDLRGNGGGTDWLGIHFAERLLPGSFVYTRLSAFLEGSWTEPHGYVLGTAEDLPRVVLPTVALIDEGCFSTTDDLLRALDVLHPDLTTVGRPTGGGTGAPGVVAHLPHSGAKVTLCTIRVFGPDGALIEGRGTLPDRPVTWTCADLRAGRDPDFESALAVLRERGLLADPEQR